jgi:hypothetical protein
MASNARSYAAVQLINLAAVSTTTSGAAVDMAAYASTAKREIKTVFTLTGVAGTTPSIVVSVEESDATDSGFAAPTQYTAATAVTTNGTTTLHFRHDKRYIRAVLTLTANTTGAHIVGVAIPLKREANS